MGMTVTGGGLVEVETKARWLMPSRPRRRVAKTGQDDTDRRVVFGQNLQIARLAQNKTQQELGAAAGISRQAVSLAERAQANLTMDHMEQLAKALGVDLSDLLRKPFSK